eukprot:Skav235116  [mRNA]  locus=scaffold3581:77746:77961:- [translate_table: standard]
MLFRCLLGPAGGWCAQRTTPRALGSQITLAFEWRELKLSDPDVVKMAKSNKESKEVPWTMNFALGDGCKQL